jgi:low temperature requirement protein LtrA
MVPPVDEVRAGIGRNASTLELFFDLVYVFAITQVVALIHDDPSLVGLGQGAFLLFLLWWTWSIYTWMTNWCGTEATMIKLFLLATMGATLLMGMAVPGAFGETSTTFGIAYFVVRTLAAGLYWFESKDYPAQRAAFFTFYPISMVGALLVLIGGFAEGATLVVLFGLGGAVDLLGAANAGRGTWAVDAAHFAERNGLFIIIALGESVVGLGLTAAGLDLGPGRMAALAVAFVGVATLWWAYFDRVAPEAEQSFKLLTGSAPGRFARDVYTLIHYPLVVGIVFFAVGLEEVVAHPAEATATVTRVTIAGGTTLVLFSVAAIAFRANRRVATELLIAAFGLLVVVWVGSEWNADLFATVTVGIALAALIAERSRPRPAGLEPG